jgi:hypothetical protein
LVSLQQELDALTARIAANKNVPRQVVAQFMVAIKEQIASGKSEHALKAGDAVPSFKLNDHNGASVSLSLLLARGPLVIWISWLARHPLPGARAQPNPNFKDL